MKHQPIKAPHLDPDNPLYWQEQHSPTEAIDIKVGHGGKKVPTKTRQRKQDARLHDGLTNDQKQAMEDILFGYMYIVGDVGFKIMKYERRIRGIRPHFDRGAELAFWYKIWAREPGFALNPALAIIVEAKSIRTVANEMRTKGRWWVKNNLEDSLSIYCKLRGWVRK